MTSAMPIAPCSSSSSVSSALPSSAAGLSNWEAGRSSSAQMPKVKGRLRRGLGQGDDARDSEDVGDLVRVGRHRRRAVRQHRADELVDPELGRLEVHVGVDEGRR